MDQAILDNYIEVDGTFFDKRTKPEVIEIINELIECKKRVKIYHSYNGVKLQLEEHDHTGYIGRSTGPIKVPILVYNKRSYGGPAISTNTIARIKRIKGNKVIYDSGLQVPSIDIKEVFTGAVIIYQLWLDGELFADKVSDKRELSRIVKRLL